MTRTAILMAHGLEECEALITVDLLRRAEIRIEMISCEDDLKVQGSHGIGIDCDSMLRDLDPQTLDLLILPGGGRGVERLRGKEEVSELLRSCHQRGIRFAAICAGPTVLGALGLLEGKNVCCFPGCEAALGGAAYQPGAEVCADDDLVTGKALGAAFPFALKLIEMLQGKTAADRMAQRIYYSGPRS